MKLWLQASPLHPPTPNSKTIQKGGTRLPLTTPPLRRESLAEIVVCHKQGPLGKILASSFLPQPIVIGLYGLKARGKLTLSTTSLRDLSDSSVTDNSARDVLPTWSWKLASTLCDLDFCRCPVLCLSKMPIFTGRFHGCCDVGTGRAMCSGPRRPISTRRLCEFGFCRDHILHDPGRPNFTNSLHDCCNAGTVPAICSGPRRPIFTRGHCDIRCCRGTLLFDSTRPSNLLGSPLLRSLTRDQRCLADRLFPKLRCIPNLLGGQLYHSFTPDLNLCPVLLQNPFRRIFSSSNFSSEIRSWGDP